MICMIIMHNCNPASDVFAIISGFIWKRTQTTQTRATPAAPSRSRLTAGCCRSRFVVANYVSESPSNAKAAAKQVASVRATATRCAPKAHLRNLRFYPNKAGDNGNSSFSKCIQKRIAKTRRPGDSAFLPPCRIHVDLSNNHA